MKTVSVCLLTGVAFSLSFAASAQQARSNVSPSDVKYCQALAAQYDRMFPTQGRKTGTDNFLIEGCGTHTQEVTAALEKKLGNNKIELPTDNRVAQPAGSAAKSQ